MHESVSAPSHADTDDDNDVIWVVESPRIFSRQNARQSRRQTHIDVSVCECVAIRSLDAVQWVEIAVVDLVRKLRLFVHENTHRNKAVLGIEFIEYDEAFTCCIFFIENCEVFSITEYENDANTIKIIRK